MSKAHSNEETLKEIAVTYKNLMRECFKEGIVGEAQSASATQISSMYGSVNNGKTLYDQAIKLFDEVQDELDSQGRSNLVNFQHSKDAHNNRQGVRYGEFAGLIGKVHEKILRNADSCCYDVINQWNGISNSINNKDDGSAITIEGKKDITRTIMPSGRGILQQKSKKIKTEVEGDVNIIEYISNNKNGFKDAFSKFKAYELDKLKRIEAETGADLSKQKAHLKKTGYLTKDIQEVNRLMSSEDKMKQILVEGAYVATVIIAGIIAAAATGGASLVLATMVIVGVGAGAAKSFAYTTFGSRDGFALDGENNYGNNVEARYARMMRTGAIDFALAGLGGVLSSMRNISKVPRFVNTVIKEVGVDLGTGSYNILQKENRKEIASGDYSSIAEQAGLIILGQGAGKVAKHTIPGLKKPTSSASKDHILGGTDFDAYKRDVAFKNGKQVEYGQGKAVDAYQDGNAVEVMNYDLSKEKGHDSLKKEIIEEYSARKADFPEGTKQTYIIDARRQTQLSQAEEDALIAEIREKTGATKNELDVIFKFK